MLLRGVGLQALDRARAGGTLTTTKVQGRGRWLQGRNRAAHGRGGRDRSQRVKVVELSISGLGVFTYKTFPPTRAFFMPVGALISKIVLWTPSALLCADVRSCVESGPGHRDPVTASSPPGTATCRRGAGSREARWARRQLGKCVLEKFPGHACSPVFKSEVSREFAVALKTLFPAAKT